MIWAWSIMLGLALSSGDLPTKVDLNDASRAALIELPGIGPKLADRILQYRRKHPFRRVTQLLRIKGLGAGRVKKLLPRVRVTAPK